AAEGIPVRRFSAFLPVAGLTAEERRRAVAVGGNLFSWDLPLAMLRERGVSIVHAHTLARLGGIARLAARALGVPLVVTLHGGVLDLPASVRADLAAPARRGIEWGKALGLLVGARRVLDDADAIVALNPGEAHLQKRRFPGKAVHALPHGVPTAAYAVDRRDAALAAHPELRGRRVLLVVGRIDPVKNQGWVVERVPALLERLPDAVVVILGPVTSAEYAASVDDRIAALGIGRGVVVLPAYPLLDPRLVGLYQLADVVVVPSLYETFGLVALEAWSAGTPVLCSRPAAGSDLLIPGENGEVFDLDDPPGFFRGLDAVLADGRRMGETGRALARASYDAGAIAGRLKGIYEEVIEAHAARRGGRR
ncbi:MAG: glycosyltransferase family 4 protein, partial [Deltaproteobacteria bacterium]|nr:glycosyltransferase family 4 protein [Deltaproteobacteria bacterium]